MREWYKALAAISYGTCITHWRLYPSGTLSATNRNIEGV